MCLKNVIKIVKRIKKDDVECVVISKELYKCKELITALNANNIKIFDGKWLQKYLALEILEYVVTCENIKKEEIEVAITTNEITDYTIEIIKTLAMQYKRVSIVTNHIEKLKKTEQELYEKNGILIVISNNQKKSLAKSQIILNLDFNKQRAYTEDGSTVYYYPISKYYASYNSIVNQNYWDKDYDNYNDIYAYVATKNVNLRKAFYMALGRERYGMYKSN